MDLHFITNLIFCVLAGVMGLIFLSIPIPAKESMKNYKISLKVLSGAYLVMSALTLTVLLLHLNDNSKEPFTFISIFISSTQALLFSFTLITLLNPLFVNKKYLFKLVFPIFIFTILYFASYAISGDPIITDMGSLKKNILQPSIIVRLSFLLFYLYQLISYTILFFKEEQLYKEELNNYFSEPMKLRLVWVRYTFISALIIGTLSFVSSFIASKVFDAFFTALFTVYYLFFAIEYIKYHNIYSVIEPAIVPTADTRVKIPFSPDVNTKWEYYKNQIIVQKMYLKEGITIEDIAQKLKIGRTTLSNYINQEEKVNFNTWINTLRIEDAKKIMLENPKMNILSISQMTGYTEQANFSRQFKQIAGESPLLWRQRNLANISSL